MKENSWSAHVEWAILMVTIIGSFYILDAKIERHGERTDRLYEQFQSALYAQSQRSDRLYEMYIDMLKDQKK